MVRYRSVIFITVIALAVLISGCTNGQDVTPIVKALPEVQQFLKEHPNAKITVTYWSKEDVEKFEEEISRQCDKPITPAAMYKATVSEGDLKIVSWINEENQKVICSITEGEGSQITAPAPTPAATPLTPATTVARVTSTAQVDWQSYCSENYPGSVYDPARHECYYPSTSQTPYSTPTQTPYSYYTPAPTATSSTGTTVVTVYVSDIMGTYAPFIVMDTNTRITKSNTDYHPPEEGNVGGYGWEAYAPVRGASVYVDGVFAGTTDNFGKLDVTVSVPNNQHTYKASANGFKDASISPAYQFIRNIKIDLYSDKVRHTFYTKDIQRTYGDFVQGASIYIDGALVGTTDSSGKLHALLTKGRHTPKASANGFEDATGIQAGGIREVGPDINVGDYPGIATMYLWSKDVRVTFTVRNNIDSRYIQGASVYMDGVLIGTTDSQGYLQDVLVSRGMHTFKVSATGFKDYTFDETAPFWHNLGLDPS